MFAHASHAPRLPRTPGRVPQSILFLCSLLVTGNGYVCVFSFHPICTQSDATMVEQMLKLIHMSWSSDDAMLKLKYMSEIAKVNGWRCTEMLDCTVSDSTWLKQWCIQMDQSKGVLILWCVNTPCIFTRAHASTFFAKQRCAHTARTHAATNAVLT